MLCLNVYYLAKKPIELGIQKDQSSYMYIQNFSDFMYKMAK